MDKQQAAFDSFIRSVHFTDQADQPITWKVPEGWQREEYRLTTSSYTEAIRTFCAASALSAGASSWHGAHQEAKKLTT